MTDRLTEQEIERIVEKSVRKTLVTMGVDCTDPLEMQRDFQALRDWRRASESIRSKGVMTVIGILVAGTLGALWVGITHIINGR